MPPAPLPPTLPDPADLALLHAELGAVYESPWLASLFMRRLGAARARLAELHDWLASLPRRLRRGWARRWSAALPAAGLMLALASWGALAKMDATITVDPGGSGCTLSAAISNANNDDQSGSASCLAGSGADTIDFASANGIYGYTSALPNITTAITIQGNGNTTIQRTGGPAFSVLGVPPGGSLAIENATITGGSATFGGGIYANVSTVSLSNTTISGNSADYGGGIMSYGGIVNLTNATISGNSGGDNGGGIWAFGGVVSLTHATISGNSAPVGGGIVARYGIVEIASSIVAEQTAGADCADTDLLVSGGYNIESATSCGFTATGDQQSVSAAALDLGALAPNPPGTTETHALGIGSVALNQIPPGTNGCGTTIIADQRGVSRPQGAGCDVGAFEALPATPTPTPTAPAPTSTPSAPTAAQVTHFAAAPDPAGRIRITWETASEVDVVAFRIERTMTDPPSPQGPPSPPRPLSPWTAVGNLIPARGSAADGARYVAADSPGVGSFAYRLVVVNTDGSPAAQGPVGVMVRALRAFLPWSGSR